jgi:hypothetical protein
MLEEVFFVLGVINNLFLIFIFLIRDKSALLRKIGWTYFLLAIPALYGIFLVQQENKSIQYTAFLGIFLVFLITEGVYDYVLKIPFRDNLKKYWKQATLYLALYYAMNYGFILMTWKYYSQVAGGILLVLFIIQIIVNLGTHGFSQLKLGKKF